MGLQT